MFGTLFFQQIFNQITLGLAEGDNTDGTVIAFSLFQTVEDVFDQRFRFTAVGAAVSAVVDAVGNKFKANTQFFAVCGGGEGVQTVPVVVVVAESNERFMTAAVVPVEVGGMDSGNNAFVENAFQIFIVELIGVVAFGFVFGEEVGGGLVLWHPDA